jgi:hypothetical protein
MGELKEFPNTKPFRRSQMSLAKESAKMSVFGQYFNSTYAIINFLFHFFTRSNHLNRLVVNLEGYKKKLRRPEQIKILLNLENIFYPVQFFALIYI